MQGAALDYSALHICQPVRHDESALVDARAIALILPISRRVTTQ